MKFHYLPIGLVVVAGLAGPVHATTWDGAQYFNRGFQCTIVPEKTKKVADEEGGPVSGMKQGRLECFGKKMRMEVQGETASPNSHGKDMSEHKGIKKGSHARPQMSLNMIMIMDAETHKSVWLVPEKRMYIESDLSMEKGEKRTDDLFTRRAELEELGRETIEGHPCRKVRPSWIDAQGKKQKGNEILWLASDLHDFPVQSMTENTGELVHYRDIKFGPVPGSRFEVPAGYTKGSMEDLMGASMSPEEKAKMDKAMKQMKEKMNSKEGKEAMEKVKEMMEKQGGGK